MYWLLKDHEPVPGEDVRQWAQWYETAHRVVCQEDVAAGGCVSTVFLGLNRRYGPGAPLLFESRVFGGQMDQEQDLYATWDDALAGHGALVARVQRRLKEGEAVPCSHRGP